MNRNTLLAAAALVMALAAPTLPARAEEEKVYSWKPYIGADFQHMRFNTDSSVSPYVDESLNGFNLHLGVRPHKNLGAEVGYFKTQKGKGSVSGIDTEVSGYGYTFDLLGYMPLGSGKIEAIGTAGVLWSKAKLDISGIYNQSESETDWRAGLGLQYNLTDKANVRAIARYQTADYDDYADNVMVYTAGVNYNF